MDFVNAGGCACMTDNNCDIHGLIPGGCDSCDAEAAASCNNHTPTEEAGKYSVLRNRCGRCFEIRSAANIYALQMTRIPVSALDLLANGMKMSAPTPGLA